MSQPPAESPITATPEPVDVLIVGGGHAGLAAGYYLRRARRGTQPPRVVSMGRLGRDTRDLYNLVAELTDKGAAVEVKHASRPAVSSPDPLSPIRTTGPHTDLTT